MTDNTPTWPDGTPRSQGNAFDLAAHSAHQETAKALKRISDATKGCLTTEPRPMHYYQKAVGQ